MYVLFFFRINLQQLLAICNFKLMCLISYYCVGSVPCDFLKVNYADLHHFS